MFPVLYVLLLCFICFFLFGYFLVSAHAAAPRKSNITSGFQPLMPDLCPMLLDAHAQRAHGSRCQSPCLCVYVASTNCPPLTTPSATRAPAKSIASKRIRIARLRHVDHLRDVDTANAFRHKIACKLDVLKRCLAISVMRLWILLARSFSLPSKRS